jgi:hypothetical protein
MVNKNNILFPNQLYCHFMYIPYTTFDIVSTIMEALVVAGHQFLYPCIVELCRLRCKSRFNGLFDLVVIVEPPVTKESFQM